MHNIHSALEKRLARATASTPSRTDRPAGAAPPKVDLFYLDNATQSDVTSDVRE